MSTTFKIGSYLDMFIHSRCVLRFSYMRTCSTEVEKLELIETLQRYSISAVFYAFLSSGTMVSLTLLVNQNSLSTAETLWKISFSSIGFLFYLYCEVFDFFVRTSWLPLSFPWIVYIFLKNDDIFCSCILCGLLWREPSL